MNTALKKRQAAVSELMKEHKDWYEERLRYYKRKGQDNNARKNSARRDLVEFFNTEMQLKMGNVTKQDMLYSVSRGKIKETSEYDDLVDLAAETAIQVLRFTYYRDYKEAYRKYRISPNHNRLQYTIRDCRELALQDVKLQHLDEFVQLSQNFTTDFVAHRDSLGANNGGQAHN